MSRISDVGFEQLARRGFVVRRHPATRRQRLLEKHAVDLVLDVGAARGSYASELRRFGYAGHIISFEPLAAAYADLLSASEGDAGWEARHQALGDKAETAEMHVASNSDSSSLLPMADAHRSAAPHIDVVGSERVEVARLDDVADEIVKPAARAYLKLDTQGFEKAVLTGGRKTLARCVGLQLELSFVRLYDGGMLADEAISFAYDQGFVLTGLDQGFSDPGGAILQADGVFFRP